MTDYDNPPDDPSDRPARSNWADRVRYSRRAGGFAHRPHHVHCADADALSAVRSITGDGARDDERIEIVDGPDEWLHHFVGDEEHVFEEIVDRGVRAEPNYVLFANPVYANPVYANPVYANPVYANPVYANPVYANPADGHASGSFANPVYANPVYASPVYANPVYANPVYANSYICTGERPSTARPTAAPDGHVSAYDPATVDTNRVIVFDTGISAPSFCPPMLVGLADEYPGQWEVPDGSAPTRPEDGYLDPSSGHGTFIAGLVHALAPGRAIVPVSVVSSYGDVDVTTVITRVEALRSRPGIIDDRTIVNMSFGGYADEDMAGLARAVRRLRRRKAVVVASAGNDATNRPSFPACLPGVVGVAALDPYGPAAYTNHGAWVSACAPGTDLVAAFYRYDGAMEVPPLPGSTDPDRYEAWARWTGTSFAAPVVSAALLRHMAVTGSTAVEAVDAVIKAPGLFRLPGLGTVVNMVPPEHHCF